MTNKIARSVVNINSMTQVYVALLHVDENKKTLSIPGTKYVIDDFVELANGHYRLTVDLTEPIHAGERWIDVYVTPWSRLETVRRCVDRMIRGAKKNGSEPSFARVDPEPGEDLGKAARMAKRTGPRP